MRAGAVNQDKNYHVDNDNDEADDEDDEADEDDEDDEANVRGQVRQRRSYGREDRQKSTYQTNQSLSQLSSQLNFNFKIKCAQHI